MTTTQIPSPRQTGANRHAALMDGMRATTQTTAELAAAVRACNLTGFPARSHPQYAILALNSGNTRLPAYRDELAGRLVLVGAEKTHLAAVTALCQAREKLFHSPEYLALLGVCYRLTAHQADRQDIELAAAKALFYGRDMPLDDPRWTRVAKWIMKPPYAPAGGKDRRTTGSLPNGDVLGGKAPLSAERLDANPLTDRALCLLEQCLGEVPPKLEDTITIAGPYLAKNLGNRMTNIRHRTGQQPTLAEAVHLADRATCDIYRVSAVPLPTVITQVFFGRGEKLEEFARTHKDTETSMLWWAMEGIRLGEPLVPPEDLAMAWREQLALAPEPLTPSI
jgi:hypothetical protein